MAILNNVVPFNNQELSITTFASSALIELKKCKTLAEVEKLPEYFDISGEHFIGEVRVAFSIQVYLEGQAIMIQRTEDIYLEGAKIPKVNLGLVDALIASRPFLPGGLNYGLLGKATNLRARSAEYADICCEIYPDFELVSTENNTETGEKCVMLRAKMMLKSVPDWFRNDLLSSDNIILGTSKI